MVSVKQLHESLNRLYEDVNNNNLIINIRRPLLNEDIEINWPEVIFSKSEVESAAYKALTDSGLSEEVIESIDLDYDTLVVHFDMYDAEWLLDEIQNDGGLYNVFLSIFNSYKLELEDLDESLTEARNPENEAFNSIIRGILKRGRLAKKDISKLQKLGYNLEGEDEPYDFCIIAPNGNYLEYYDGYMHLYDKNDDEIKYSADSLQDVDWQNLLNSHNAEDEEVIRDDISDFAIAKKQYNKEKAELDDIYSRTKDTQLDTIQYRRSNPNKIHNREEKYLKYQKGKVQRAKEKKDAILRRHGINPRESFSIKNKNKSLNESVVTFNLSAKYPEFIDAIGDIQNWIEDYEIDLQDLLYDVFNHSPESKFGDFIINLRNEYRDEE